MPYLVYAAILVATVSSVALEWDALVQPSAATRPAMHAATEFAPPPRAAAPVTRLVPAAEPAKAAAAAPAQPVQPAAAETPPTCDVDACAAAYRTFRASDCTYMASAGVRRLCTKGAAAEADSANAQGEPLSTRCHIRACSEYYSSFNPSDCTYQPLDGPRRMCTK